MLIDNAQKELLSLVEMYITKTPTKDSKHKQRTSATIY